MSVAESPWWRAKRALFVAPQAWRFERLTVIASISALDFRVFYIVINIVSHAIKRLF